MAEKTKNHHIHLNLNDLKEDSLNAAEAVMGIIASLNDMHEHNKYWLIKHFQYHISITL